MGQFSLTCRLCGPYWRPSAGCRSHITRDIFIHAPYILLRCLPRHLPAANSPKITSKTLGIGRSCMTCSLCGPLWRSTANCRSIFPTIFSSHEQCFLISCLQRHSPSVKSSEVLPAPPKVQCSRGPAISLLEAFWAVAKESSESLLRRATHASSSPRPSPQVFEGTGPPLFVLPSPFIVVAVVVERLNAVSERQSRGRVSVVISVRVSDIHSSLLVFSNLVAGFQWFDSAASVFFVRTNQLCFNKKINFWLHAICSIISAHQRAYFEPQNKPRWHNVTQAHVHGNSSRHDDENGESVCVATISIKNISTTV